MEEIFINDQDINGEGKDVLISGIAADGFLRVIGVESTHLVEKARITHNASPTATAALGRMLTGTVLMAKEMKNDTDKLTIQLKGKGPIGGMATVCRIATKNGAAGALGKVFVKGYADNPHADLPTRERQRLYECYDGFGTERALLRKCAAAFRRNSGGFFVLLCLVKASTGGGFAWSAYRRRFERIKSRRIYGAALAGSTR